MNFHNDENGTQLFHIIFNLANLFMQTLKLTLLWHRHLQRSHCPQGLLRNYFGTYPRKRQEEIGYFPKIYVEFIALVYLVAVMTIHYEWFYVSTVTIHQKRTSEIFQLKNLTYPYALDPRGGCDEGGGDFQGFDGAGLLLPILNKYYLKFGVTGFDEEITKWRVLLSLSLAHYFNQKFVWFHFRCMEKWNAQT